MTKKESPDPYKIIGRALRAMWDKEDEAAKTLTDSGYRLQKTGLRPKKEVTIEGCATGETE